MKSKDLIRRRRKWLRLKKISIGEFAKSTNNDFGTAYKWFDEGRTPRRKYLDDVLAVYPDWPC